MKRTLLGFLVVLLLISAGVVLIPAVLIRPFVPQTPSDVAIAHLLRGHNRWVTLLLGAVGLMVIAQLWTSTYGRLRRSLLAFCGVLLVSLAILAWQNQFEWMFHPISRVAWADNEKTSYVKDADMVLAFSVSGESRAVPVPLIAYHHIVNMTVGGMPVVATYCTLCHTGLVWKSMLDGRVLHFRLAGINNQNFVMMDEETGTWWQQVTGKALVGPLQGKRLEPAEWDEISFAVWKREYPSGQVLMADAKFQDLYAKPDWETRIRRRPTVIPADPKDSLKLRDLVVGVSEDGNDKAYPLSDVLAQSPIIDNLGSRSIVFIAGPDGSSVRCFERSVDNQTFTFSRKAGEPGLMIDSQTGSEWDFTGKAVAGPLAGKTLPRVQTLKDFWFDWKLHHPATIVYRAGAAATGS